MDSANSQLTDLHRQIASDNSTIANLREQVESGNRIVTSLNSTVTLMQGQAETNKATIAGLQSQLDEERTKTSNLGVQAANLQSQVENLTAIVNALKPKPQTLVFHVCEKGEGYEWGRLPDSNSTYNEILNLTSDAYNVLLLPEYMGNEHWNETFAWLKKNFTGIPLMLTVFEGGTLDYPLQMLTTGQISEAMNSLDVRGIRIFEVVSWHIEHNMTFPVDYVTNLLTFCRANNLTVFWSEWKIGDDVFGRIQNYIAGFEDIVVVSFGTNSGDLEPADGFLLVGKMFEHWGGSVQSWYWVTRYGGDPLDMPISLFIDHALLAKFMGAEVIQFEPYWYFFDNGLANENVKLLADALNAQ